MSDLNYRKFKVVCQICGKTGVIDTTKFIDKTTEFFRRMDCGRRGSVFGEPQIDFWVCRECLT